MRWLDVDDLIQLNRALIENYTPEEPIGVHDWGGLESAQRAPSFHRYYEQTEDVYILAAVLLCRIIGNHPFSNANKRTGFAGARVFLRINGYALDPDMAETIAICEGVATHDYCEEQVAAWLADNSAPEIFAQDTPQSAAAREVVASLYPIKGEPDA